MTTPIFDEVELTLLAAAEALLSAVPSRCAARMEFGDAYKHAATASLGRIQAYSETAHNAIMRARVAVVGYEETYGAKKDADEVVA